MTIAKFQAPGVLRGTEQTPGASHSRSYTRHSIQIARPVRPPVAGAAQADDGRTSVVRTYSSLARGRETGDSQRFNPPALAVRTSLSGEGGVGGVGIGECARTELSRPKTPSSEVPAVIWVASRQAYPNPDRFPTSSRGSQICDRQTGCANAAFLIPMRRAGDSRRGGRWRAMEKQAAARQFSHDALRNLVEPHEAHSRILKSVSRALSCRTRAATPNDTVPSVLQHKLGERDGRKTHH